MCSEEFASYQGKVAHVKKVFFLPSAVDITHQHFTHNQHAARIFTAVFSTSVVVSVCVRFRFPDTQCCTDRTFIFGSRKESLHMVAEHKTPTVDASHDGPDAVPRSDAAGTGASAAAHGSNAAADATDAASGSSRRMRRRLSKVHLRVVGTKGSRSN